MIVSNPKVDLLGIPVSRACSIDRLINDTIQTIRQSDVKIVTFINPHSYWVAERLPNYLSQLKEFDEILCDGQGAVAVARWLGFQTIERVSFDSTSIALPLLRACSDNRLKVFLVGGREGVAKKAGEKYKSLFPELEIVGEQSGYFSDALDINSIIVESGANIVICGMGAPLQEDFLCNLKKCGWKGVAFSCGGYLDQSQAEVHYYPEWINKWNLRFLYRLFREPKRLWKRYLIEYSTFLRLAAVALAKQFISAGFRSNER